MPAEYLACIDSEMKSGKPKKTAQRICAIRYYKNHGTTVQEAAKKAGEHSMIEDPTDQHAELTSAHRNDMEGSQFAVPGKRKLPINDANHVRNAMARFNQTQGLTSEERATARKRIIAAAKKFGIDTSNFSEDNLELDLFASTGAFLDTHASECASFPGDPANHLEPWLERPAKIFRTGQHREGGHNYTQADLEHIAASFQPPTSDASDVPLLAAHNTTDPHAIQGGVRKLWTEGGNLFGIVRAVGRDTVSKVASKLWHKLSAGIDWSTGKPILDHVAVVTKPQLRDAAIFSKGATTMKKQPPSPDPKGENDADPDDAGSNQEDSNNEGSGKDGKETDGKKKAKKAGKEEMNMHEDAATSLLREEFEAKTRAMEARLDKFAEYEKKIETLEAKNAELEAKNTFAEMSALVDTYSEQGKTFPAMRGPEVDFLTALQKAPADLKLLDLYKKVKDATPAISLFERQGRAYVDIPADAKEQLDAHSAERTAKKERLNSYRKSAGPKSG